MKIVIPGQPIPKGRPRFARGRVYTPQRTKDYEERIAWYWKQSEHRTCLKSCTVEVHAYFKIPKTWSKAKKLQALKGEVWNNVDCDNILKILDSLNGLAFEDDRQIVKATVEKSYSEEPRLEIKITPLA